MDSFRLTTARVFSWRPEDYAIASWMGNQTRTIVSRSQSGTYIIQYDAAEPSKATIERIID